LLGNSYARCSWTSVLYTKPVADTEQSMINPTLSHEDGVMKFTFQRLRNTSDSEDWSFGDSHLDDCYYFMFPVGGGPVQGSDFSKHSDTPKISRHKICICTYMISLVAVK